MRIARWYVLALVLAIIWLSAKPLFKSRELGSKERPINLMLTPSTDAQAIIRNGEELGAYLYKKTGLHVRVSVPNYYITVVEAFGTSRADIAIMNTFSYLLANSKYNAQPVLKVKRRHGELSYRGEFIVRADKGITSLSQLEGKTIAFVDPSSTSGYIYPSEMLKRQNIKPKEEMFANGHSQVVMKVYQGEVDAGAVFYSPPDTVTGELLDARCKVATQFPDVYDRVKIIALTDPIPNDPVVVRNGLPHEIVEKLVSALLDFQTTAEGKAALMAIASVEGFVRTNNSDYNEVRNLVARYGINLEAQLKNK